MTIPSRPAPPPPGGGTSAQNGRANDASFADLRKQLEQQRRQQQQAGNALPNLMFKLPPPPSSGSSSGTSAAAIQPKRSDSLLLDPFDPPREAASTITRKFPKARLSPAAWDESIFDSVSLASTTSSRTSKKVPPPRPPPPKIRVQQQTSTPASQSTHDSASRLLTNLFNRKKGATTLTTSKTTRTTKTKRIVNQNHVYGLSSGINNNHNSSSSNHSSSSSPSIFVQQNLADVDWNDAWNNAASITTTTSKQQHTTTSSTRSTQEAQLITFDSPTSSPTFTQKSKSSDCVSVDSLSLESNFNTPSNGFTSQPESGFEDDFSSLTGRSRPPTVSPYSPELNYNIGTAPVRNLGAVVGQRQDNPLCNGKSLLPPTPALNAPTIIKPKIAQKPKAPRLPPPPLVSAFDTNSSSADDDPPTPPSPPMPSCAPPPPPPSVATTHSSVSILDVIQGKVDALSLVAGSSGFVEEEEQPYAIALYDFNGEEDDDLMFRANEKIFLLERASENWFRGRTRAGCVGIFPSNYVEIKVPLREEAAAFAHSNITKQSATSANTAVRCLYNFPAQYASDLALNEGDVVNVLHRIDEDWLFGEIGGRKGQFPANFIEYVPQNLPTAPS